MKKNYIIIYAIAIFAFFGVLEQAHADDFKRDFQKSFSVDGVEKLLISNKFGKVNVTDWNKNSVDIKVVITVDASSEEDAKKLFDKIKITLEKKDDIIKGITEINGNIKGDISIDYEISMPASLNLELTNKYGDTFISKLTGIVDINIHYGHLKANKLLNSKTNPKSKVYLAYSEGSISECDWLKLLVNYSKLDVEKGNALMVVSKYSKLDIGECKSIVADSKYDTPFKVNAANNVIITGKYSKYQLGKVNSKLRLSLGYSNVTVETLSKNFSDLTIENKYGNIKIDVEDNVSFKIKGEANYGNISLPETSNVNTHRHATNLKLDGVVGDSNTSNQVSIKTKYGSVSIK